MKDGLQTIGVVRSAYQAGGDAEQRIVACEVPVAIEINGIAYAVMMATPEDLADFVTGFILSEDLAQCAEIGEVALHRPEHGPGIVARIALPAHRLAPVMERARRRLGDSSCGICGVESLGMALRPLEQLPPASIPKPAAIAKALNAMRDGQVMGRQTGGMHAAAFSAPDGSLLALREDVGRHNALDKVIGYLARNGIDPAAGFLLVTSRASYELVEKAVRARCPLLVAISAPTHLAVERARSSGLALAVLARDDSMLWVSGPAIQER